MAAFTFTADARTDNLTITAHGLNTGDGPAAVRNIGGTLPAATPSIGPVLDRFIIRVDANTIRLRAEQVQYGPRRGEQLATVADDMRTELVCIPRPIARSDSPDGGRCAIA
jgi:hypothetical protein